MRVLSRPLFTTASAAAGEPAPRSRVARSRVPKGARRCSPERALSSSAAAAQAAVAQAPAAEQQQQEQHTHLRMLSRYRALLLDATYRPVGVANWQRAICLDLMEKAEVLEYYEDASVRSTQLEYFLPAVLRVRRHRPTHSKPLRVTLNRANILLRDQYSCQYCGSPRNLTIDHVKAQSKGGGNNWENLVACCTTCNSRKGDKSLEQLRWKLRQTPKEPSPHEMEFLLANALGSAVTPDSMPREWSNYILPFARKKKAAAVQAQPGHLHDAS